MNKDLKDFSVVSAWVLALCIITLKVVAAFSPEQELMDWLLIGTVMTLGPIGAFAAIMLVFDWLDLENATWL